VSLLRRAGFGALAPEELSTDLKGMVNRKKQALVADGVEATRSGSFGLCRQSQAEPRSRLCRNIKLKTNEPFQTE
jgi:hypothetical protein